MRLLDQLGPEGQVGENLRTITEHFKWDNGRNFVSSSSNPSLIGLLILYNLLCVFLSSPLIKLFNELKLIDRKVSYQRSLPRSIMPSCQGQWCNYAKVHCERYLFELITKWGPHRLVTKSEVFVQMYKFVFLPSLILFKTSLIISFYVSIWYVFVNICSNFH